MHPSVAAAAAPTPGHPLAKYAALLARTRRSCITSARRCSDFVNTAGRTGTTSTDLERRLAAERQLGIAEGLEQAARKQLAAEYDDDEYAYATCAAHQKTPGARTGRNGTARVKPRGQAPPALPPPLPYNFPGPSRPPSSSRYDFPGPSRPPPSSRYDLPGPTRPPPTAMTSLGLHAPQPDPPAAQPPGATHFTPTEITVKVKTSGWPETSSLKAPRLSSMPLPEEAQYNAAAKTMTVNVANPPSSPEEASNYRHLWAGFVNGITVPETFERIFSILVGRSFLDYFRSMAMGYVACSAELLWRQIDYLGREG